MSSSRSRRRCCRARARWTSTGPSKSSARWKIRSPQQLGYPRASVTFTRAADLRYTGQAFELTVPGAGPQARCRRARRTRAPVRAGARAHLRARLPRHLCDGDRHASRHRIGHARGRADERAHEREPSAGEPPQRSISAPSTASTIRRSLRASALDGKLRAGPLIVEEYEGTTVVPPNCAARLDDAGNIVIEVGRAA